MPSDSEVVVRPRSGRTRSIALWTAGAVLPLVPLVATVLAEPDLNYPFEDGWWERNGLVLVLFGAPLLGGLAVVSPRTRPFGLGVFLGIGLVFLVGWIALLSVAT